MSEHAARNLVMARPRIEENLATGVSEQMRIEPEARITEHCPAKLHRQRSGGFCPPAFAGEKGTGREAGCCGRPGGRLSGSG